MPVEFKIKNIHNVDHYGPIRLAEEMALERFLTTAAAKSPAPNRYACCRGVRQLVLVESLVFVPLVYLYTLFLNVFEFPSFVELLAKLRLGMMRIS